MRIEAGLGSASFDHPSPSSEILYLETPQKENYEPERNEPRTLKVGKYKNAAQMVDSPSLSNGRNGEDDEVLRVLNVNEPVTTGCSSGFGMALPQLNEAKRHLTPFKVPISTLMQPQRLNKSLTKNLYTSGITCHLICSSWCMG